MNAQTDTVEAVLAMCEGLTPAQTARLADALMQRLRPACPVPALEDQKAEAAAWVEATPEDIQVIYLVEMWLTWTPERRAAALGWFVQNINDGKA